MLLPLLTTLFAGVVAPTPAAIEAAQPIRLASSGALVQPCGVEFVVEAPCSAAHVPVPLPSENTPRSKERPIEGKKLPPV